MLLSSCVVTINTATDAFQDELYYSSEEYAVQDEKDIQEWEAYQSTQPVEESEEAEEQHYDDSFDYESNYDFSYAVRLRRFYGPSFGFGYYNNYYTNSYWYTHNPHHCGLSIYYGHHWDPWYYDPWYSPYYSSWPYHYHSYYHSPYFASYYGWNTYHPIYFNSHDHNTVHYGPRQSRNSRLVSSVASRYKDEVRSMPNRGMTTGEEVRRSLANEQRSLMVQPTEGRSQGLDRFNQREPLNNRTEGMINRQPIRDVQRAPSNMDRGGVRTNDNMRPEMNRTQPSRTQPQPSRSNYSQPTTPSRSPSRNYSPQRSQSNNSFRSNTSSSPSRSTSPSRSGGNSSNSRKPR